MRLRLFETKKLHYGEYLYKLVVINQLSYIFRTELQKDGNLGYARQRLDMLNQVYSNVEDKFLKTSIELPWSGWRGHDRIPLQDYFDGITLYRNLKKQNDYKLRVERYTLHYYTNSRDCVVKLINSIQGPGEFHEPKPGDIELLKKEKNIILVDYPPDYKYKITLGGKKGVPGLASWIDKNPNLAKMGKIAKDECQNQGYVKGYYFFVKDDKALFIAQLLVGDNIARIDKIVYRDE